MPSRGSGPSLAAGPGAAVPLPGCLCAAPQRQAGCSPVPRAVPCWGAAPVPGGHPGLAGPSSPCGSASRCGLGDGSERRSLSLCPELPSARVPQREWVTACPCPTSCRGCGSSWMERGQDEANVSVGCNGARACSLPQQLGAGGAVWDSAQPQYSPRGAWLRLGLGRNPPKGRRRKSLRFLSAKMFAREKDSAVV